MVDVMLCMVCPAPASWRCCAWGGEPLTAHRLPAPWSPPAQQPQLLRARELAAEATTCVVFADAGCVVPRLGGTLPVLVEVRCGRDGAAAGQAALQAALQAAGQHLPPARCSCNLADC